MSMGFVAGLGLGVFALASWTAPQAARQRPRNDTKARLKACFEASDAKEQLASVSATVWLGEEVVLSGWSARESGPAREGADFVRPAPWALEALSAVALLRLVDADKLEFDDLVSEHLPELKFGGQSVTVEQVLAHTSARRASSTSSRPPKSRRRPKVCSRGSVGGRSTRRRVRGFAYSESNALIAVALVTKLAEKPVHKALREWVLEPAGMLSTSLELGAAQARPRSAAFYAGGAPADAVAVNDLLGVTALTTTFDDLARLLRGLNGELLSGDARRTLLARTSSRRAWRRRTRGASCARA